MMIEHDVMLDIEADVSSEEQLADMLGVKEDVLDRRELTITKTGKPEPIWMIESDCDREEPLEEHIKSILDKINKNKSVKAAGPIKRIYLNIGVFFETAYCSVYLPAELLSRLLACFPDATVLVNCYPSEEPEE
jgi:hypothetical protein